MAMQKFVAHVKTSLVQTLTSQFQSTSSNFPLAACPSIHVETEVPACP